MIQLSVTLNLALVESLGREPAQLAVAWEQFCRTNAIVDFLPPSDALDIPTVVIGSDLARIGKTASYIKGNLDASILTAARFFPRIGVTISHDLTVAFVPFGRYNYGPKEGLQLFSLLPAADPYEAYLFLTHVYYHEISFLNYTETCRDCSVRQDSVEQFKYWLMLLIRNEGIANLSILKELLDFRDQCKTYEFKYFAYARQLGNKHSLCAAISLLNNIFESLNEQNYKTFREEINAILKNKKLSIINLIGTHIARTIADYFGLETVLDVYKKPPGRFFDLYFSTNDLHRRLFKRLGMAV